MEYDENTAEDTSQVPVIDSTSSEIVSSPQVIKEDNLTNEQIANRIILQLQYNNDCYLEQNEILSQKLDSILEGLSVSENDVPEDSSFINKPTQLEKYSDAAPVYTVEDDVLTRDLLSETVSQNDIINMDLMTKDLSDFNVTESLLVVLCLLLFAHFVFDLFKKY